jgi:hypothetical protein
MLHGHMPARVPRAGPDSPVEGVWCCVDDDVSAIRPPAPGYVYVLRCDRVRVQHEIGVQPVRM